MFKIIQFCTMHIVYGVALGPTLKGEMFSLKESDSTPGNSAPAPSLFVLYSCSLIKNSFRLSIDELKIITSIHGIPGMSTSARFALRSSRSTLLKVTVTELQAACASGEKEKIKNRSDTTAT